MSLSYLPQRTFQSFAFHSSGCGDDSEKSVPVPGQEPVASSEEERPTGLCLFEDFVSEEEEERLWALIREREDEGRLRHRSVFHYGLSWDYSRNRIHHGQPRPPPIPPLLQDIIARLPGAQSLPDQVTVNIYPPGAGIPPHTDSHASCGPLLFSLSLLSPVLMTFVQPNTGHRSQLLLPSRSLLKLSHAARYLWTHAIPPRHFDPLPPDGRLLRRQLRISLTFRRFCPTVCLCPFPHICDDPDRPRQSSPLPIPTPAAVEGRYVTEVSGRRYCLTV